MWKNLLLISLFFSLVGLSFSQTAIINEWSQGGTATTNEWVEILVLQDNFNMQNWTLRDGGGSGVITFSGTMWQSVPVGAIIVIYNSGGRDPALPADDLTFGVDRTVVMPGNSAGNLTQTAWINFSNTTVTDNPILRDAGGANIHDWDQGDNTAFTGIAKRPGSNSFSYFTSNTTTAISDTAYWILRSYAVGSPSPSVGNGGDNSNWIATLRGQVTPPSITSLVRDLPNPTTLNPVNLTATVTNVNGGTVILRYFVNNMPPEFTVPMTFVSGNSYVAQIPSYADGTFIEYYATSSNPGSSTTRFPASSNFHYRVQNNILPDQSVVVNEIMAIPGGSRTDWFELLNNTANPIDVSYFSIQDNQMRQYAIPFGTVLTPGGYMVFAQDSAIFRSNYPSYSGLLGPSFGFGLDDGGDQIRVYDANSNAMDSVAYTNASPWPIATAGNSIELIQPSLDNNVGSNWRITGVMYGTPGAMNSGGDVTPPVLMSGTALTNLRIDLVFNEPLSTASANLLSNYSVAGRNLTSATLQSDQVTVVLLLNSATPLVSGQSYNVTSNNIADVSGNISGQQSVQVQWNAPPIPAIVISEIMYNPGIPADPQGEWFEIYNSTSNPIDLLGWSFADNAARDTFRTSFIIQPSEYKVLAYNPDTLLHYGITAHFDYANAIQLANASDRLVIHNNSGVMVDSVSYSGTAPWPVSTNGYSISLIDPSSDNTLSTSWAFSPVQMTNGEYGTPGLPHLGGDTTPPTLLSAVVINSTTVSLVFNEPLNGVSANNASNYTIDGNRQIVSATLQPNGTDVYLTVGPLPLRDGFVYTVSATNISDMNNNISGQQIAQVTYNATSAPNAPSGVVVTRNGSDITITWSPVAGAVEYKIWWAPLQTGTWQVLATVVGTTLTYSDVNILNTLNVRYYRVTAVN